MEELDEPILSDVSIFKKVVYEKQTFFPLYFMWPGLDGKWAIYCHRKKPSSPGADHIPDLLSALLWTCDAPHKGQAGHMSGKYVSTDGKASGS